MAPMAEVAGRLSVIEGASCLKAHELRHVLLVSGMPGTKAADIVIICGGVVGANAARLAVGFGARHYIRQFIAETALFVRNF